ncbi:hypothetical protein MMC29_008375 [Sticta canariensis]|nr:hypothetical protein [Sticta canariensis]
MHAYKDMDMNLFQFDDPSLSEWFMSDTALMSAMPELSTCWYEYWANGPSGMKISVLALTTTSTSTVQGSGHYNSHSAQPANTVFRGADIIEKTSAINAAVHLNEVSPSPAFVRLDQLNLPQPSTGIPGPAFLSNNPETLKSPKSPNFDPQPKQQSRPVSAEKTNPTLTVIFGGSTINADWLSYYPLPSIVTL